MKPVPASETPDTGAPRLLVVDTDPGVCWSLEKGLGLSGYQVVSANSASQAAQRVEREYFDCVLYEIMPEAGLTPETLSQVLESKNQPSVICVSIDAPPHVVIDCMRRGASDFLVKPFSLPEIRAAVSKAATPRRNSSADAAAEVEESPELAASLLVGVSPPMQELRTVIKQVAQTDLNCLIRGPSGAGKDVIAREIHRLSRRADKPLVKVNCGALPEQLLESELFGYERGAFTGAVSAKPGRFSLADKGVIFLDEICEMHPNLQAKLLQVIEHKEFTKLGGRHSVKVDVQIIAATNADIEVKTENGSFRQDLYFRLNEVCIWAPPLNSRKEDIPLLVRHFAKKYSNFAGDRPFEVTGEDLTQLTERDWHGNVRELESTIKRWLVLGKTETVTSHGPGRRAARPSPAAASSSAPEPAAKPESRPAPPREVTPDEILEALEQHQWNRRRAAEALGISYQVLRRRIEKHNLDQPR
ncbi:MAG: sigma-54-dependent Fis family transcriptional regulator [Candidatus Hydrogenedentes bacterium]|nr:sigma-54-dependent Fis family transcriptional regulator [Candidatus Hydrogenedentota bacterium]